MSRRRPDVLSRLTTLENRRIPLTPPTPTPPISASHSTMAATTKSVTISDNHLPRKLILVVLPFSIGSHLPRKLILDRIPIPILVVVPFLYIHVHPVGKVHQQGITVTTRLSPISKPPRPHQNFKSAGTTSKFVCQTRTTCSQNPKARYPTGPWFIFAAVAIAAEKYYRAIERTLIFWQPQTRG